MVAMRNRKRLTTRPPLREHAFFDRTMIENLRKYPGVIIAALVAVFIGFLLMDSERFFRQSGANSISVNDVSYDINEFRRIGPSSRKLGEQMSSYQSLDLYRFINALTETKSTSEDAAEKSFFVNRLLLQQAGRDFGIQPGDAEIQAYIRERSVFADSDPTKRGTKQFNQENYQNFIRNGLGKSGLSEADLFLLIKDFLTYEKLQTLLGGAIAVNPDDVKQTYQAMSQKVAASYVTLPLADFTSKQQPTEQQIKEYWELRKDSFKTETRRKFSYVIGKPQYPQGAEKAPEPPKPAKAGDPAPEPSAEDKAILEKRRKAELEVAAKMDDILAAIEASKGGEFENAVKKEGWEIRVTDLFTASTIPDVLLPLTPRKTRKTLAQLLFDLKTTSDPISQFTSSFPVGEADWFIARLDSEEESRVKTFEEAKEEATKQWVEEKGKEALKTAAEELKKKIEEAIKANKSFADAAKDAGHTTSSLGPVGNGETPAGKSEAPSIFSAAQYVNPGNLTEIIYTDKGALIAIVDKREIEKDPNGESMLMGGVSRYEEQMRVMAFQSWLSERSAASKVSQ
ncbi:MAG: hypothetical protein RI957_136 [Verrucomicrobiota bacterium]|jgi:peptidyl-prolyl cis-trans isomerase D